MQLDVGGIAKGYAADEALAVLKQLDIPSALVAASGDLAFGDPPPGQRGWKIGVDSTVLDLRNAAVSTSGDAEQGLDSGGKRYSHIVDPATRMGLTRGLTVTPNGITSDGIATAVSVLGADRGLEFVEKQEGVAALIVLTAGGVIRRTESSRFKQLAGN
jgi:thiamine biosynthesis lipoprotein